MLENLPKSKKAPRIIPNTAFKQLDTFFLFFSFFFFLLRSQRSSRGELARRINAVVRRAIAGVFRAVDSVHCRNERVSLVGGRDNGCGDEVDVERERTSDTTNTSRDYCKIYYSCSFRLLGRKETGERERKARVSSRTRGETFRLSSSLSSLSSSPSFFSHSFFPLVRFLLLLEPTYRRFLVRPAESLTIRAEEETVRTSSISELYNAWEGERERERLGKVFVSSSFYDGRYSLRETLEV